jgi:hypothetical protein
MKIEDFKINEFFYGSAGFHWKCTDIGQRTISAICVSNIPNSKWMEGPPYMLKEECFDEEEMTRCYQHTDEHLLDVLKKGKESYHPGFSGDIFFKLFEYEDQNQEIKYPRENLFRFERVGENGEIYHLYNAVKKNEKWFIKVVELFSEEFSEIEEDKIINLKIADEEDIKKRAISLDRKPLFE